MSRLSGSGNDHQLPASAIATPERRSADEAASDEGSDGSGIARRAAEGDGAPPRSTRVPRAVGVLLTRTIYGPIRGRLKHLQ